MKERCYDYLDDHWDKANFHSATNLKTLHYH